MILTMAQVALGGALGASARYLTGLATIRVIGPGFPWRTLTVNIFMFGVFLMGAIVVVLGAKSSTRPMPFLLTGALGGFITFSAFPLDAASIPERDDRVIAITCISAFLLLSPVALALGFATAQGVLL